MSSAADQASAPEQAARRGLGGPNQIAWPDLPERYRPYMTVCNRFSIGAPERGNGFACSMLCWPSRPKLMALIDSSITRAHKHAASAEKGSKTTPSAVLVADRALKINAVVDENGLRVRLVLTAGQAHDLQQLGGLRCRIIVADRSRCASAKPHRACQQ